MTLTDAKFDEASTVVDAAWPDDMSTFVGVVPDSDAWRILRLALHRCYLYGHIHGQRNAAEQDAPAPPAFEWPVSFKSVTPRRTIEQAGNMIATIRAGLQERGQHRGVVDLLRAVEQSLDTVNGMLP